MDTTVASLVSDTQRCMHARVVIKVIVVLYREIPIPVLKYANVFMTISSVIVMEFTRYTEFVETG